jgi:hypothetical protein
VKVSINIAFALGRYGKSTDGVRFPGTMDLSEDDLNEGREMATPVLLAMLDDSDRELSLIAADSLSRFGCRPDVVVPKLIEMIRNSHGALRQYPLSVLSLYGQPARSAVPEVLTLLHDPEALISSTATNALKAIDPELAAKMGIK